jgi:hypothetical protein
VPTISSISPSTFDSGRSVVLSGSGFGAAEGTVTIGGQAQTVTAWADTEITFTTVRGSQSMGACRVDVVGFGAGGSTVFADDFESGDLTHTQGAAAWTGWNTGGGATAGVGSVQTGRGSPGYGANFQFTGGASGTDSSVELRFDLGALYTELTVMFDMYIPDGGESWGGAAYAHRNDSPGNNKLIRLWGVDYADDEKVGASLFHNAGYSNVNAEWSEAGAGIGVNGQASAAFIEAGDLGTWINVKVYVKAPTASTDGVLRIYKNGTLLIERTAMDNYAVGEAHAYRYGYLMGWANSGFAATTHVVLDNVVISEGEV